MKFFDEYDERHQHSYQLASEYMNPKLIEVMDILGFNKHYTSALGNYLYDAGGTAYLDMHSGEGFASLGHNHPEINRALIYALNSNLPDGVQIHHSSLSGLLAEKLCERLPDSFNRAFFTNSGAETVEAALKFARAASRRPRLLACESGYHGLTYGALSVSSESYFRDRFGPLLPGCDHVPYNDLERLEAELKKKDVAAFIVEPIQGRAVTMPDADYFKEVERLCRKYNTFLIFDEIQTGLGRTGRWFALEHWGIEPDFVLVAKALSGGHMPVGAMISRRSIFDKIYNTLDRCYVHHSTYGRNRLAMVAGLATLEVIESYGLVKNAEKMGDRLMAGLRSLQARYSLLKDVRGKGLEIGFELGVPESFRGKMEWKLVHSASAGLFPQLIVIPLHRDHKIITMSSGHNDVIKLLPPLVITEKEVDYFLDSMASVLEKTREVGGENWKTIFQIAKNTLLRENRGV
ncbi:MAG: aminobacteriohopanetriol synthase HpnO [Methylohalobius crimeensis]